MTAVAQILEEIQDSNKTPIAKPGTRSDDAYVISALADGLKVLEALKGQAYEAVTIREVSRRTCLTYDFCRRALKTLKVSGWTVEDDRGWRLSVKAMQFSSDFIAFAASLPGASDSTGGIADSE